MRQTLNSRAFRISNHQHKGHIFNQIYIDSLVHIQTYNLKPLNFAYTFRTNEKFVDFDN
jgi:hypothetical protein